MGPAGQAGSSAQAPKNPRRDSLYGEIVHLIVGPMKIDFGMHKGLLCHYSSYFAAAFTSGFKEASEKVIYLPEDSPRMMKIFNLWLYTQSLMEESEEVCSLDWKPMTDLYIWADKRIVPKLQDAIIDAMMSKSRILKEVPIPSVAPAYDCLPVNSPLRRYLVDACAHELDIETESKHKELAIYPKEFLFDLCLALYRLYHDKITGAAAYNFELHRCKYHIHPANERCHLRRRDKKSTK